MHLLQRTTRTEAVPLESCSARLGFTCKLRAASQQQGAWWCVLGGPGRLQLCRGDLASPVRHVQVVSSRRPGPLGGTRPHPPGTFVPGRSSQHVDWRKARAEAVAAAVVVCCVVVGSDILLLFFVRTDFDDRAYRVLARVSCVLCFSCILIVGSPVFVWFDAWSGLAHPYRVHCGEWPCPSPFHSMSSTIVCSLSSLRLMDSCLDSQCMCAMQAQATPSDVWCCSVRHGLVIIQQPWPHERDTSRARR